ncbi:hypothetical protein [Microcystis sp. M19BS1]|uniref:hypothetical protein n=1 Tax=Microcystis sp. M19BS1 TaxID=2771180 RepID=UPI0025900D31|nr:hypothetical protein [Microcystis sp. M19BS1]
MTLPIVGSRYGFATYGWRTSAIGGVHFNIPDFLLFLDAIGITSTHRFVRADGTLINLRFPEVDTDLIQLGNVTESINDGRHRVSMVRANNDVGTNPFFWSLLGHTYATKTQLNDSRSTTLSTYNSGVPGYFYACADNRGIAMFAATNTGLSTYSGQTSFHYFGYCEDPASVAYFGNNDRYPLDYVGSGGSNFKRYKEMMVPGGVGGGQPSQPVVVIGSINCVTPTPDANSTDLMFRDNGFTDYGTDYPLGRARPFLLFINQNLAVNSLVRVLNEDEPTPEDHFHIVVSSVTGGGSILMPIITENYTLP